MIQETTSLYIDTRDGMILAMDLDPELDFKLVVIPDPDSDQVKSGIITLVEVLWFMLGSGSGVRFSAFWPFRTQIWIHQKVDLWHL